MFGDLLGDMKRKQEEVQATLEALKLEASDGEGLVKVTVNGKRKVLNVKIDQKLMADGDAEAIEDLLLVALNRALDKAAEEEAKLSESMVKDIMPPGLGGLGDLLGG